MIIKAISVDDEPRAHRVIEHHASKIDQLELVQTFTSPVKALAYLKETPVDLLFLDINMPDMDGISLLKSLKNLPAIIFTTAYDDYAVQSYDFEAVGYLLKPIEFPKFYQAVSRVLDQAARLPVSTAVRNQHEAATALLFSSGAKILKFKTGDIRYIEAAGNYARVFLADNSVLIDHSLKEILDQYQLTNFLRIHRSYIINLDYLQEYEGHQLMIADAVLPIGKTYRKYMKAYIDSL